MGSARKSPSAGQQGPSGRRSKQLHEEPLETPIENRETCRCPLAFRPDFLAALRASTAATADFNPRCRACCILKLISRWIACSSVSSLWRSVCSPMSPNSRILVLGNPLLLGPINERVLVGVHYEVTLGSCLSAEADRRERLLRHTSRR